MGSSRPIGSLLLLAAFLLGGLAAPVLHRLEHAVHEQHVHVEVERHRSLHPDAPTAGFLVEEGTDLHELGCPVCDRIVSQLGGATDITAFLSGWGTDAAPVPFYVPVGAHSLHHVRGPPVEA